MKFDSLFILRAEKIQLFIPLHILRFISDKSSVILSVGLCYLLSLLVRCIDREIIIFMFVPCINDDLKTLSSNRRTNIQDVPGGMVNILGGHSISHSKQKYLYKHASYSERFPRWSNLNVQPQNY